MKVTYNVIKKIHLYAGLSIAAVLIMFILTSYLMIHHNWFKHELKKEKVTVPLETNLSMESDWTSFISNQSIQGRLIREISADSGQVVREYASAAGSTKITISSDKKKAEIITTRKTRSDAIIGIHRQKTYGGPVKYWIYAFLLDLVGIGLILFTITGIIMWFNLLKNNKIAWLIFIGGFIYFSITIIILMSW